MRSNVLQIIRGAFKGIFQPSVLTANRTYTYPDISGNVPTLNDASDTSLLETWSCSKTYANVTRMLFNAVRPVSTTVTQSLSANSYITLVLPTVNFDPLARWNSGTNIWTVPETGRYMIMSKMRIADDANAASGTTQPPRFGYSQGVHTSNVDGFWYLWSVTNSGAVNSGGTKIANRNILFNMRINTFTVGDLLRMYAFVDQATAVWAAELTICKIL